MVGGGLEYARQVDVEVLDFDLAAPVAECAGKDFGEAACAVPASCSLAHCELLLPKGMSGGNGHCLEWNVLDDPGESDGCRKIPGCCRVGCPVAVGGMTTPPTPDSS